MRDRELPSERARRPGAGSPGAHAPGSAAASAAGGRARWHNAVLAVLIGAALYLCWLLALPFLPALVWALALAILLAPLQRAAERALRRPGLAAAVVMLLAACVLALPAFLLGKQVLAEAGRGLPALQHAAETGSWRALAADQPRLLALLDWIARHVDMPRAVADATTSVRDAGAALLRGSVVQATGLLITVYLLFYFLRDRVRFLRALFRIVPLHESETRLLLRRVADSVHATVYGTLTVAALQGALGGLMFWWLDLPAPLLWGMVMGLLAIVPVLGAFLVWMPAAAWLMLAGDWGSALMLALWGTVVVGGIDNLVYPILVGDRLHLHTVPAFIAIVGGLLMFGSSGLLAGPMILTVTVALLEIWRARLPPPGA